MINCGNCLHLFRGFPLKCAAFPQGIPPEIMAGEFNHREPYPGDNGIQYEPIDTNDHNNNNRPRRSSAPSEND